MDDHLHFVEMAALAASDQLAEDEQRDLDVHLKTCADCKNAAAEFRELVLFGMPSSRSRFRQYADLLLSRPEAGAKERFLRRASSEGVRFSSDVFATTSPRRPGLRFAMWSVGAIAALVIAFLVGSHQRIPPLSGSIPASAQQGLTVEATISHLQQSLVDQQRENESLRARVARLTGAASSSGHANDQTQANAHSGSNGQESIQDAEMQRNAQEKLLSGTTAELEQLKKARAADQATLVSEQIHINQLSDQLKAAKANASDMQKQLVAAGADVHNLMGARQLHIVDVRDTDPDGKPGKAFGRIFLTEGKSLVFYAFDLNDLTKNDGKKTFQVWGQQEGKSNSLRSLGFLNVDDKAQRRWSLKTDNVAAFKQINSIFVTVEPQGGAKSPGGQRLLFASLGEANHP